MNTKSININNYTFKTFIWNKGDKPEKSMKRIIISTPPLDKIETQDNSLLSSSSINIPLSIYREASNKREESSNKISERYLVHQRGQNPFITTHNSYVNDIETQQSFLIPKCSNEHPKNRVDTS